MWLNLYGREAVRHMLQNRQKMHFLCFWLFLSLCRTASQPYKLSHIYALRINQFYLPKDQSVKFSQKFWLPGYFFLFYIIIFICLFKYETIKTHARVFLTLNILAVGSVYGSFSVWISSASCDLAQIYQYQTTCEYAKNMSP